MADAPDVPVPVMTPAQRERASQLLASRKDSLAAIDPASVGAPRVSAERGLELTAAIERLGADLPADGFPFQPDYYAEIQALVAGGLMDAALVCVGAEAELGEPWTDADEKRLKELRVKVRAHDALLTEHGRPFFANHPTEAKSFAAITPGTGPVDDRNDVTRHVAMWLRNPDLVGNHPIITPAWLAEADADATELARLEARLAERPKSTAPAVILVRQASHAWALAQDKVLRVGRFFAPKPDDWPGISRAPVARGEGGQGEDGDDETEDGTPKGGEGTPEDGTA